MKSKLGDKQRLQHILHSIQEIENYTADATLPLFASDSMMRFATIKQIEIIGEAANYLTDLTKDQHPQIEWRQIVGLRDIVVHEYFGIDTDLVWQIASHDIPLLKKEIEIIISTI